MELGLSPGLDDGMVASTGAAHAATGLIDWQRPWLGPLRAFAGIEACLLQPEARVAEALNAAGIRAEAGAPQFEPQASAPARAARPQPGAATAIAEEAYEARIARTGRIPTRNNLHDLFNGLIWLRHPALKRRMNRLQAEQIARDGVQAQRGPLRDALTLFDEFGALWLNAPPLLVQALVRRDWQALFVQHRALWAAAPLQIIGHALLEQLATAPRKGLTAHVALSDPQTWSREEWASKPFAALPVLGIPQWWPANEEATFYADTRVFRPAPVLKACARP